ncbi:hypothetical protein BE17_39985 [Sorangium cellulosum]|uniref:Uncharacterized protein n=1 Tax=Sorangium cellulosum TaxID=56 RepID=A0A150RYD0_SORCE|nr:hypothetical protein BE17_39985 [Sorangium cellulosum]
MPLAGVVVAGVRCDVDCPEGTPALVVKDKGTGAVLAGTQELVADLPAAGPERALVFRPAAPLADGHKYSVTLEGQDPSDTREAEVMASADLDLEVGAHAMDASVRLQDSWYDTASCCEIAASICGPEQLCVGKEVERYVIFRLHNSEAALEGAGQYVQTVTFLSPDGAELDEQTDWGWNGSAEHMYMDAAPEYCYQVTYKSLIDGATIEKERTCVPHGDAGATGVFPTDMEVFGPQIGRCSSPPEGFEDVWSAARKEWEAEIGEAHEACSVSAGGGASSGWALSAVGLALALAGRVGRRRSRR